MSNVPKAGVVISFHITLFDPERAASISIVPTIGNPLVIVNVTGATEAFPTTILEPDPKVKVAVVVALE